MAFDYKKEYKEFYLPPRKPGIVTVPPMNFVSVQGRGDPNEPGGEYALGIGNLKLELPEDMVILNDEQIVRAFGEGYDLSLIHI